MKLYDHQKKILKEDKPIAGLFLGTGSGKTRIALGLAVGSTLVICPKTQKEDENWERESVVMHSTPMGLRITRLTTISKETFRRDHAKLPRFDTVIVDEAHTCLGVTPNLRWRNKVQIPKASQIYEALEEYLVRTKPYRFYLCTATIMRSPMTVWAAARLLGHNFSFYSFRHEFYIKLPMPGREVWAPKTDTRSKDKLAAIVRSIGYVGRLEDFFDVPDQTHKVESIELSSEQKKRIKELRLEYPEPIVRLGKTHQVENGVLSGDEFSLKESFANGKIERILDLAAEFPRMVVFAKYRAQIDDIEKALKDEGYKVLTLTGDTKDRGAIIKEANESDQCVFIAQAQVSAGWELPHYPLMVFASKTYSFVDYDQSVGRIQRANNIKKNLYIHLVAKGEVDEAVHQCIEQKKDFNERLFLNI